MREEKREESKIHLAPVASSQGLINSDPNASKSRDGKAESIQFNRRTIPKSTEGGNGTLSRARPHVVTIGGWTDAQEERVKGEDGMGRSDRSMRSRARVLGQRRIDRADISYIILHLKISLYMDLSCAVQRVSRPGPCAMLLRYRSRSAH